MAASMKASFGDEVLEKLKEVAWFAIVAMIRFLLEQLTSGNPEEDGKDAKE